MTQDEERYLDPDASMIDGSLGQLVDECTRLRASARHWRSRYRIEARRATDLQRRLNQALAPPAPTDVTDATEIKG